MASIYAHQYGIQNYSSNRYARLVARGRARYLHAGMRGGGGIVVRSRATLVRPRPIVGRATGRRSGQQGQHQIGVAILGLVAEVERFLDVVQVFEHQRHRAFDVALLGRAEKGVVFVGRTGGVQRGLV